MYVCGRVALGKKRGGNVDRQVPWGLITLTLLLVPAAENKKCARQATTLSSHCVCVAGFLSQGSSEKPGVRAVVCACVVFF